MRTIFRDQGPDNSNIEIREVIIGARALVRLDPLPGPALIDLRSGEGSLQAGDRSIQLGFPTLFPSRPACRSTSATAATSRRC